MLRSPAARAIASLAVLTVAGSVTGLALGFRAGRVAAWDAALHDATAQWGHEAFGRWLTVTSLSGWTAMLAVLTVLGAIALWRRAPRVFWFPALATAGAEVIKNAVKIAVDRPRPPLSAELVQQAHATGSSFPSGHALHAVVLYGAIALLVASLVDPRFRTAARLALLTLALAIALAVAISRVALGVHYPSDVLASLVLGTAWLAAYAAAAGPVGRTDGDGARD